MTVEDLQEVFEPFFENMNDKLELIVEDIANTQKIMCGFMVAIGVLAGIILISYLLDRF